MDMDHTLSSWLMRVERQFTANSIIRYMSPLWQGVKGFHHPHLFTCSEDWAKINKVKASLTFPLPPSPRMKSIDLFD